MLTTLVDQLAVLIDVVKRLAQAQGPSWLQNIGITSSSVQGSERQLAALLQRFAGTVLPVMGNVFGLALKGIVVAALLVYVLIYGPRTIAWVRRETPRRTATIIQRSFLSSRGLKSSRMWARVRPMPALMDIPRA